jgi:hypothetical protein
LIPAFIYLKFYSDDQQIMSSDGSR